MTQPELSIVIPFLNEKRVLPLLRERFEHIAKRSDFWELIFVSDGSTDGSTEYVEDWSRVNPAVKLVVLTRNFGHQYAVSAGLANGRADGLPEQGRSFRLARMTALMTRLNMNPLSVQPLRGDEPRHGFRDKSTNRLPVADALPNLGR